MNKPLSCSAQDLLEAAIVQRRRLNLHCKDETGQTVNHRKIIPIDIFTESGSEQLAFMTSDNHGGIIKLSINTELIVAFEAEDFLDPRISYSSQSS